MLRREHVRLVAEQIKYLELVFVSVMLVFILILNSMSVSLVQTLILIVLNAFMMQQPSWGIVQYALEQEMLQILLLI